MHNNEDNTMKEFLERNKAVFENPILKSFITDKKNYNLIMTAIDKPTKRNKTRLDLAFKDHYREIKKLKYFSSLIHFFSIDYDKRVKKLRDRNMLILDQDISPEDNNSTIKDQLVSYDSNFENNVYGSSLLDHLENEALIKSLKVLSTKQQKILEMKYLHNLTLKEIAELIETSPQNVSNLHKKALNKLYKKLKEKESK